MAAESLRGLAYLAASLLFIGSLRGLSAQVTARRGNLLGLTGMILAVVAAVSLLVANCAGDAGEPFAFGPVGLVGAAIAIGAAVGAVLAARVAMTAMPELVAMLHSFVGLAAVLVGFANYLQPGGEGHANVVHLVEIHVGVIVGAITFSGSLVAFGKLRGLIGSKPLLLPGRHAFNAIAAGACAVLAIPFALAAPPRGVLALVAVTIIALVLGIHLVAAIGGGDMPVVVSLLNSYSGWAAAAAGFMLSNDLLIVTGALVGSSGAILSAIMCRAMNRSIWNVVFGGFGAEAPAGKGGGAAITGTVQETSAEQVASLLKAAKSVIIVPGYGMAVAQAQHAVRDISTLLIERGVKVRYAIHPVAGRLPGHMNVLLAEADVSYEIVEEMDEINDDFPKTDVVLVIGANDIVNPSALDDPASPIYGMPVLEVWRAARVVMLKRSMAAGYAGVENPLCFRDNTLMLFGDAKASVTKLASSLR